MDIRATRRASRGRGWATPPGRDLADGELEAWGDALDRSRLRKRYGALSPASFDAVTEAVLAALGVDVER